MEFKTKFDVGETVYFLHNNELYKGVINQIIINVRPSIFEKYEVSFTSHEDYEALKKNIDADCLFESKKEVIDNLMLDFEKREEEND